MAALKGCLTAVRAQNVAFRTSGRNCSSVSIDASSLCACPKTGLNAAIGLLGSQVYIHAGCTSNSEPWHIAAAAAEVPPKQRSLAAVPGDAAAVEAC